MPADDTLLEPMSIFIKLAIISFKPVGTKISINHNTIILDDANILQGIKRTLKRSSREEISLLFKPLKRVLIMYPPNDDHLIYIYNRVLKGIDILKHGYSDRPSTLIHSLDLYSSIIKRTLETKSLADKHKMFVPEKLYDIWTTLDIELIYSLLYNCEVNNDNIHYMESIENVLISKQNYINTIISQII
jgi:hypothetical protein